MTLESDVLSEIKPSPEECEEILAKAERLRGITERYVKEKGLKAKVRFVGSVGKGTYLRNPDIDLFLLFSEDVPRDQMEKLLNALPGDLSVGEIQRVAFALVLIKEPKIVVLDEPTGTMDPITKIAVAKAVIKARNDLNETFIVVSHDMDFILNCCDRVALMKDGKITSIGGAEEQVEKLKDMEKEILEAGGEL